MVRSQRLSARAVRPVHPMPDRSLGVLASLAMVLLVVYASLYPFEGWRWPAGLVWQQALSLPWPPWRDHTDEWLNRLGYVPLGFLLTVAYLRVGWPALGAAAAAAVSAAGLSYTLEVTQILLPARVPSLRDWSGNTAGAAVGALLALGLELGGLLRRGRVWRDRWFTRDSAVPLILLLLWPAALLVPAPMPFALGQCWDELLGLLRPLMSLLPLSAWGLDVSLTAATPPRPGLSPLAEVVAIALGLVSPLALAGAIAPSGPWRASFMLVVATLGLLGMTLSTAMNFGPAHAGAWLTPTAILALVVAAPLALLLLVPDSRLCAALGLMVIVTAVVLAAQSRTDAYYAASLQAWEQGRFIRFHGLAQWVGWLWPYLAMGWLLQRLRRDPESLQFRG